MTGRPFTTGYVVKGLFRVSDIKTCKARHPPGQLRMRAFVVGIRRLVLQRRAQSAILEKKGYETTDRRYDDESKSE